MAKKEGGKILNLFAWITGVLVSLAVGFGMADGVLSVRWIPAMATQVAGWVVVISTLLSVILAVIKTK